MELLTTIPLRADGTVLVNVPTGFGKAQTYIFTRDPELGAPSCADVSEEHAKYLLSRGTFLSREDFVEEQELRRRIAERNARARGKAAVETFVPGDDDFGTFDADDADSLLSEQATNAAPTEASTRPTGRVRKAGGK